MCLLRLTQLYNILLLLYYWLQVSATLAIIRPIFTKICFLRMYSSIYKFSQSSPKIFRRKITTEYFLWATETN